MNAAERLEELKEIRDVYEWLKDAGVVAVVAEGDADYPQIVPVTDLLEEIDSEILYYSSSEEEDED